MSSGRVFVVQQQHHWSEDEQRLVPKFDLSPAREHGELVYLLSPSAGPWNLESVTQEMMEKLRGYGDADSLLLVGNPCLIGIACVIAAAVNRGRWRMLQWSGKEGRYLVVSPDLGGSKTDPSRGTDQKLGPERSG